MRIMGVLGEKRVRCFAKQCSLPLNGVGRLRSSLLLTVGEHVTTTRECP